MTATHSGLAGTRCPAGRSTVIEMATADGELLGCELNRYLAALNRAPVRPGRYRARRDGGQWQWEPLAG